MADITTVLLSAGKRLISSSLAGFSIYSIHSFRIGSTFGYEANSEIIEPEGTTVFTGYAGLTQSKMTEIDTVRHTIVIPEHAGPFLMGNIVLYGAIIDGAPVPFLNVIFPFAIQKIKADPQFNSGLAIPTPGSRFVINVDIKHSLEEIEEVTVNVVSPEYASLPFYDTEANVPAPALNPWPQFIVNYDTRLKSPALVTKKSDGTYWAIPLNDNFHNPKFGITDGGIHGDGLAPSPYGILSGYFYTTPDEEYAGTVGGMSYDYVYTNEDQDLGGMPYNPDL